MAIARTINITASLHMTADSASDKDIATLASACASLAKASASFLAVKTGKDKRAYFASIASASRLSYDDAAALVGASNKDSAVRLTLRTIRANIVQRIRAVSVVHDAANDAATVQRIDRIVSHMGTIAENSASIVRTTVEIPATV